MKSKNLKIRDCALLIGFDPKGHCVYSDAVDISSYYDGEHVWDSGAKVKKMKLEKVMGYLFDAKGELFQQFESIFCDIGRNLCCSCGHLLRIALLAAVTWQASWILRRIT